MKALIDSDIVAYSCSCISDGKNYRLEIPSGSVTSAKKKELNIICDEYEMPRDSIETFWEPEPVGHTCHAMKLMLQRIMDRLDIYLDDSALLLSDSTNFRHRIDPEYKANRRGQRVPANLLEAKEYLKTQWQAHIYPDHEADDALGILQYHEFLLKDKQPDKCETIICTIDKDLDMIPGWHYNWYRDETYWIEEHEALRIFYEQLLKGDKVDNIIGLKGVGPVKAAGLLKDVTTEEEMWRICVQNYVTEEQDEENGNTRCLKNARLLWILRKQSQIWEPPE